MVRLEAAHVGVPVDADSPEEEEAPDEEDYSRDESDEDASSQVESASEETAADATSASPSPSPFNAASGVVPDDVDDARFEVTKINNLRDHLHTRRQRRVVVLTRHGLRHVRMNGTLRRYHPYRDVAAALLATQTRLRVSFLSANTSDLCYETPDAVPLARELSARRATAVLARSDRDSSSSSSLDDDDDDDDDDTRRLQFEVARALFDPSTTEGRAVTAFVSRFRRQCAKNRICTSEGPQGGKDDDDASVLLELLRGLRVFLDGLLAYVLEKHTLHMQCALPNNETQRMTKPEEASRVLASVVERCVATPLLPLVERQLSETTRLAEFQLQRQRVALKHLDAVAFGAPKRLEGCRWDDAIQKLSKFDAPLLAPSRRLSFLLDAARAVHDDHQRCHGSQNSLAADDFLPVLVFVLVKADVSRPLLAATVARALGDPAHLRGEPGYYLTALDAAIEYIRSGAALRDCVGDAVRSSSAIECASTPEEEDGVQPEETDVDCDCGGGGAVVLPMAVVRGASTTKKKMPGALTCCAARLDDVLRFSEGKEGASAATSLEEQWRIKHLLPRQPHHLAPSRADSIEL